MSEVVVLARFAAEIRKHLVANYLDPPVRPLILGIFGRPGDGKSAQLMAILEQYKVNPLRINAADLESGLAGEPGKLVERTYAAGSLDIKKEIPTAIIVDDIDTTMGEWEHNTGTVNHQQVLAELMHLADRPVDPIRSHPCRVPIFMTGNDLKKLYPPLRRHKRMLAFHWRPTVDEVRYVVNALFGAIGTQKELDTLAKRFSSEPLSFFGALHQAALETQLHGAFSSLNGDMREVLSIRNAWRKDNRRAPLEQGHLLQLAAAIQAQHKASLENYLNS